MAGSLKSCHAVVEVVMWLGSSIVEGLLELVIPLWERVELLFKIRQLREVKKNGCRRVLSEKG